MKFTCLTENLAKIVTVSRTVSPKSTMPILRCILITAQNGRVSLSGTNLEVLTTVWIDAFVEEEGAIAVPDSTFTPLVKMLENGRKVTMSIDGESNSLKIVCCDEYDVCDEGSRKPTPDTSKMKHIYNESTVKGLSPKDFPNPFVGDFGVGLKLDAAEFIQAVLNVAPSASKELSRPALCGVFIELENGRLSMVSTDGFRLSRWESQSTYEREPFSMIVPARSMIEVSKCISPELEYIFIAPGLGTVMFDMGDTLLLSNTIDETYPNYKPIIPNGIAATKVVVDMDDLRRCCTVSSIFAKKENNISMMYVTPDLCKVAASAEKLGENETDLVADVTGKSIEFAFNIQYLTDTLKIDDPQVTICLNSNYEPMIVSGKHNTSVIHIIMPVITKS